MADRIIEFEARFLARPAESIHVTYASAELYDAGEHIQKGADGSIQRSILPGSYYLVKGLDPAADLKPDWNFFRCEETGGQWREIRKMSKGTDGLHIEFR